MITVLDLITDMKINNNIRLLNHGSLYFTKNNLFHCCAVNGFYMMITNSQVLLKILG